jgi:molecular chaperone GrpE
MTEEEKKRETEQEGLAERLDMPGNGDVQAAPAEERQALQKELDAAKAQGAEYLEGWQRARADFANYKRRVEKEQSEAYQNAASRVIGRFVDVLDDFDRAVQDRPADDGDATALAQWAAGVSLIQRKLQNILDAEGVERIPADGQSFDPALHEAVTHEDSDQHQPGQVIGVLRQGYRIGDRVIRPALVRVAR